MRQDERRVPEAARVLGAALEAKAARIRLLLFDVDGVLTDGKVQIHGDGTESKQFDIKDGISMVWAQRAGLTVGLLSARTSASTTQRAEQLGIQPHIVEATLNHISGHKAGVAGIYNRASYEREKVIALDLWGERLMAIVENREATVVPLHRQA